MDILYCNNGSLVQSGSVLSITDSAMSYFQPNLRGIRGEKPVGVSTDPSRDESSEEEGSTSPTA